MSESGITTNQTESITSQGGSELNDQNQKSQYTFDFGTLDSQSLRRTEENYETCEFCERKFFVGRLKLHQKSCKQGKPLKPLKAPSTSSEERVSSASSSQKKPNALVNSNETPSGLLSFRDFKQADTLSPKGLIPTITKELNTEQTIKIQTEGDSKKDASDRNSTIDDKKAYKTKNSETNSNKESDSADDEEEIEFDKMESSKIKEKNIASQETDENIFRNETFEAKSQKQEDDENNQFSEDNNQNDRLAHFINSSKKNDDYQNEDAEDEKEECEDDKDDRNDDCEDPNLKDINASMEQNAQPREADPEDNENEENDEEANMENNEQQQEEGEEEQNESDNRTKCSICSRMFLTERIAKHEAACKKGSKKRPIYDTKRHRMLEEQRKLMAKSNPSILKKRSSIVVVEDKPEKVEKEKIEKVEVVNNPTQQKPENETKVPKWKIDHENFIKNIRFNKKLKEMEMNGEDTSQMKAPETINPDYVHCKHCQRSFAAHVAERHIPKCKNIFNRPKPPKSKLEETSNLETKARGTFLIRKHPNLMKKPSSNDLISQDTKDTKETEDDVFKSASTAEKTRKIYPNPDFSDQSYDDRGGINSSQVELRKRQESKVRSRMQSQESGKQKVLPDLKESLRPIHTLKKANERNLSPAQTLLLKERNFKEILNKKTELLQNYEHIIYRSSNISTEQCPHCDRKFAPRNAERHVSICKNIRNRSNLKSNKRELSIGDRNNQSVSSYPSSTKGTSHKRPIAIPEGHSITMTIGKNKENNNDIARNVLDKPPLTTVNGIGMEKLVVIKKALLREIQFCGCCGNKVHKEHNFCGNCGEKKANELRN